MEISRRTGLSRSRRRKGGIWGWPNSKGGTGSLTQSPKTWFRAKTQKGRGNETSKRRGASPPPQVELAKQKGLGLGFRRGFPRESSKNLMSFIFLFLCTQEPYDRYMREGAPKWGPQGPPFLGPPTLTSSMVLPVHPSWWP